MGHGPEIYSLEHDIALGKQLSQEVEKSAKFIDDPVVIEYVNRVGQNLVRNSDAQVPFTIKVIDSDVVNAFALPGGFFYVNSGLILHADEESELAGVMAHEIAHVCARHGTREQTKSTIVQLASIPAMIFIPYSWAGYAIYQGMNFAIPLTFLKFSRGDEAEADYLGLQYMYKAGYDPNSFVSFFEKVQSDEKKEPGTIPKVFLDASADARSNRSHPEGNRHDLARAGSVHRDDFGVRHGEGAPADDRSKYQGEGRESEQADSAEAHLAEQGRQYGTERSQQHHFRRQQHVDYARSDVGRQRPPDAQAPNRRPAAAVRTSQ